MAARSVHRQRLAQRAESLKEQAKHIRTMRESVDMELRILNSTIEEVDDDMIDWALQQCVGHPMDKRDPTNLAIRNWAEQVGLPTEVFIDKLNVHYSFDVYGNPDGWCFDDIAG